MEFYDDDLIGDEFLGSLTFDIGEELRKLPLDCRNAEWHQAFPLEKVPRPCARPSCHAHLPAQEPGRACCNTLLITPSHSRGVISRWRSGLFPADAV